MALIGKHQIELRVPANSELENLNFNCEIEFSETDYFFEKKFGTDRWVLEAGKVLSEMIESINDEANTNSVIQISNLKITSFKKGLMQWSTHKIETEFSYQLLEEGSIIKNGTIEGIGSGSGTEFGFLTFIPIIGNMNFDKGIEIALYRSLELALTSLNKEIRT